MEINMYKKNKVADFFFDNDGRVKIVTCLLLGMLPFLMFLLGMLYDGISFSSLRLPSWSNDEFTYYYQVEGILKYGMPQGLFGYNESYSNIGSLGAWSPALLFNYIIFGFVFGWGIVRASLYNFLFLGIAMFLFGMLARPNKKQLLLLVMFYLPYTYITNMSNAISPEATCYSYAIIFIGLCYSAFENNKLWKVILMFFVSGLLTTMRPYYGTLVVAAGYFLYKLYKKKSLFVTVPVMLISVYVSGFLLENFCNGSPIGGTFTRLVKTVKLNSDESVNGHSPILAGSGLLKLIKELRKGLKVYAKQLYYFFSGNHSGRNFFIYMVFFILLLVLVVKSVKMLLEFNEKALWICYWLCYLFVMFVAICLKVRSAFADRHLAEFVIMLIFVFAMEFDSKWQYAVVEVALIVGVLMAPNGHRNYSSLEEIAMVDSLREELKGKMPLTENAGPTWDNTVLWVFADMSTGEFRETPWRELFALPSGFGCNLVYDNWINNAEHIKSRYIATTPDGDTEKKCVELGAVKIAETEKMVIYQNY